MSPQHIECGETDANGITSLKIWYDDPENEDPSFGEDGEQIMHEGHGRDAWLAQMYHHLGKLKMAARAKLGAGKVYEIRAKIATNFGMNLGVAWYTTKGMQALELVEEKPYPGELNQLGGYFFMGRFKT